MPVVVEQVHRIGKDFILAGDATFTIECPEDWTAEHGARPHYTYRVQHVPATDRYAETWFVKLLVGADNTRDYKYLGRLDCFTGQVSPTGKSGWSDTNPPMPVRLLNRLLARVWTEDHDAYRSKGFKLHHEGRCGRCGRKLTVPASVESGIGPECVKHLHTY